jgi:hypothetical protein
MRLFTLLLAATLPTPLFAADPPTFSEDMFPLAVGNNWTYRVQTPQSAFQEDRFVVRVVRQEMVGEQTCFLLEGKLRDRVTATEHVAFTKQGLTRFRADGFDISPPLAVIRSSPTPKFLKTEYQLGDRKATATFSQEPGSLAFQGKETPVMIVHGEMAGENGGRIRTTFWYAAGVGMVRQRIDQTVLELEKFEKGEPRSTSD